ncbi:MAG: type II secretion system protein GspD [Verrucomicrobia bacterium]|nr:type II secretion system protein GspD [Verrucomicrobiota bacterium]
MKKNWFKRGVFLGAVAAIIWGVCSPGIAQQAQRRTTSSYGSATEVGEAMVTSDPETRKLIVVTDDETAQYISQVITNLDRAAPQVLINVVFMEVTYRDGVDIGINGTYTWQGTDTSGGVVQNFNAMPGGLTSGGTTATVIGDDFTVTLRALAEQGRLQVLSRPTILARNNQQATITVGQSVPLVTGVVFDNFGNQRNTISYRDVGIILTVTPFITSDELVEMIVTPEISNLSDQTVPILTGTNTVGAPVINQRAADTVVVTPSGQTVVIGGLIQDNKTKIESKTPVLGDIPLLGAAFRRRVEQNTKTELLIFLTPRIVKHPSELAALTTKERGNTVIMPKSFKPEDLDKILEGQAPRTDPLADKRKKKKAS